MTDQSTIVDQSGEGPPRTPATLPPLANNNNERSNSSDDNHNNTNNNNDNNDDDHLNDDDINNSYSYTNNSYNYNYQYGGSSSSSLCGRGKAAAAAIAAATNSYKTGLMQQTPEGQDPQHSSTSLVTAASSCSSWHSYSSGGALRLYLQQPILAAQGKDYRLTQPGAPPRTAGPRLQSVRGSGSAMGIEKSSGSVQCQEGIAAADKDILQRPETTCGSSRRAARMARSSTSTDVPSRPSTTCLSARSGRQKTPSSSASKGSLTARPPSPRSVMEAIQEQGTFGKGTWTCRSDLLSSIEVHEREVKELARRKAELRREEQAAARERASQWSEEHKKDEKLQELRWLCREPDSATSGSVSTAGNPRNRGSLVPGLGLVGLAGGPRKSGQFRALPGSQVGGPGGSRGSISGSSRHTSLQGTIPPLGVVLNRSSEDGRHVTTPVLVPKEKPLDPPKESTRQRLQDSSLKPKQALEERLQVLRCNAKGWWKEVKSEWKAEKARKAQEASASQSKGPSDGEQQNALRPTLNKRERLLRKTSAMLAIEANARRQLGFEDLDLAAMKKAVRNWDVEDTGRLDHTILLRCLHDLGLQPKTSEERQQVREIIWDFNQLVFTFDEFARELVPKVREHYDSLREPRLKDLFKSVDTYGRGGVTVEEVVNSLRRTGVFLSSSTVESSLWAHLLRVGQERRLTDPKIWPKASYRVILDEDGFVGFVRLAEEYHDREAVAAFQRIVKEFDLSEEMQELWRHDLVDVWKMFYEFDPCRGKFGSPTGKLDATQLTTVLRESGYMPKTRTRQQQVFASVPRLQRSDGSYGFLEFLQIMYDLRQQDRERLRKIVDNKVHHNEDVVPLRNLGELLIECGVMPRNPDERAAMKNLVEAEDQEDVGVLTRDEVVALCQQIKNKVRRMQREREKQYVLSSGWNENNLAEFRTAFQTFDEDMSESLERGELSRAIELLKGRYWQTQGDMDLMLVALGIDPSKEIKVNFLTFLRMLKMLEEAEARWQQGAGIGFTREQTDRLHSAFRGLQPDGTGDSIRREVVEKALSETGPKWIQKSHLMDVLRAVGQESPQVEFAVFLKYMKSLQAHSDGSFEEFVGDVLAWEDEDSENFSGQMVRKTTMKGDVEQAAKAVAMGLIGGSKQRFGFSGGKRE